MNLVTVGPFLLTTTFALGGILALRPLLHRARAFRLLTFAWVIVTLRILVPAGFEFTIPPVWSLAPSTAPNEANPATSTIATETTVSPPETPTIAVAPNSGSPSESSTANLLLLLWASGTTLILGAQIRSHRVLRRRLHAASSVCDPRLQTIVLSVARELGLRRPIDLRMACNLPSPAICGLWRPCLLFPSDQVDRLSDDELRHIVLHELAHWRHGDLGVQHLLRVACAVHWFNPLAWLALRAFRQDCELASDHFVIRHTSPAETSAYGATLLKLLGWVRGQTTSTAPALGVVGSSQHLKQRLHMLLNPRSCSLLRTTVTTTLIATVLLASTLRPAFAANEAKITTVAPTGWFENGNQTDAYTVGVDFNAPYRQPQSAYVKSDRKVENKFGGMMQTISPENYIGKRVRMSAAVKTRDAVKGANLWLRIDGAVKGKMLGFDNMGDRPVTGSSDWTECSIVLDVPEGATNIAYGFFISNTGQAWVNDLKFETVSKDTPLSTESKPHRAPNTEPVNLSFAP